MTRFLLRFLAYALLIALVLEGAFLVSVMAAGASGPYPWDFAVLVAVVSAFAGLATALSEV